MKYVVLAILATMTLFAASSEAEDLDYPHLNNNAIATHLLEKATPQPKFIGPPLESLKTDTWYLKFLKNFSMVEYGTERESCLPAQGILPRRKAVVTRFKLFNKPIYLTFSIGK
jgi:hypothetical protein